ELKKKELLEKVGGEAYLIRLTEEVSTSAHIDYHTKLLNNKATLRKLISVSGDITTKCFDSDAEFNSVIDFAESKIFDIAENNIRGTPDPINEILAGVFDEINSFAQNQGPRGLQSGFSGLDTMTNGFHGGELIITAARPGRGKTAFALSMLMNISVRAEERTPSILFSLEMSKSQLIQRMLCSEARIDMKRLRSGKISKRDMELLIHVAQPLYDAPVYVDDTTSMNPIEIMAKCRRIKKQKDLGLVIVDYLQLMSGAGRYESRQLEIASISRSLKGLSKELNVPVIALSQLSRDVEKRGKDTRPQLSDLRESGAIEQDADLVMFIHRPETHNEETSVGDNVAEIIVGKQRNGPVGSVRVSFVKEYAAFENLDEIHSGEEEEF
ncbi:MAG: replicative DNA helicase, partial [Chitinivibrionales bacterium]